jgi:hypothetical protein
MVGIVMSLIDGVADQGKKYVQGIEVGQASKHAEELTT